MSDEPYAHITDSSAEHLHPGDRMIVPDEALFMLDMWMEQAWRRDESERFFMMGDLLCAVTFEETILW